eukprot:11323-Heterococcus_DN1.PRE.4
MEIEACTLVEMWLYGPMLAGSSGAVSGILRKHQSQRAVSPGSAAEHVNCGSASTTVAALLQLSGKG